MLDLAVYNPNFSIIAPVGCNAACGFCFWDRENPVVDPEQYLTQLWDTMESLPYEFEQCSITGGEPTMLPWLKGITRLARERFDKVVLSTNGFNLAQHLDLAREGLIDHLNISRHGHTLQHNQAAFNTDLVIDDHSLTQFCTYFQRYGIDTTLNCVLPSTFNDSSFIYTFVDYAKSVNANAIAFRKDHSDLEYMGVENDAMMGKIVTSTSCPVCRNDVRLINGMRTTWKYSIKEPSNEYGSIYELIYHQDGRLTSDWEGQNVVDVSDGKYINTIRSLIQQELYRR